ncbi:MAG: glycoside hydrolase family 97 protein, partial [Bacteroidota bacterium]
QSTPNRKFQLTFKVYDDGLGFRYSFPEQEGMDEVTITDEHTHFNLTSDPTCWWIPGDWDIYEHLYNTTRFSEIDAISKRDHPNLAQTYIPENAVNTPITMKTDDGIYLSFHEANLTDYSGMTLKIDADNLQMVSELVGRPDNAKATVKTPFSTPWRTIQITDEAGDLIASNLIVNLNEPNKLEDTDWIEPMKYIGIWWEMHLGKSSWGKEGGMHGATTENTKKYIDFAADHGIKGVLVEGWNTGWEVWLNPEDRIDAFDFVTPYDDYNIQELAEYAKSKGVSIIGHHETSAVVTRYDEQMDTAYAFFNDLGIKAIKTGYVGKIHPEGQYHHGQYMVNHYRRALTKAAANQIMVDAHEPIKATGIRRTYPNMVSREGLRGQEFNAWSVDMNPPEHTVIVAFTRMLGGPIDFTPGIFDIKFEDWKPDNQVNTTLAKQLALYVTLYSPVQMAADLPENYEGNPAFQFIEDVAVDWDTSIVLNGEVGDYVSIVRKEKDGNNWFLGSITDEDARELPIDLSFLEAGKKYEAIVYADGENAHWDDNPLDISITKMEVDSNTKMTLKLAAGGGTAISFRAL